MRQTSSPQRKRIALAAGVCAIAGGGAVIWQDRRKGDHFHGNPLTVDIGQLPAGKLLTVEWQGRPVWILRRTAEDIAALAGRENGLADPASEHSIQPELCRNHYRSLRPGIFVAIGICTHLGCTPILNRESERGVGRFVCPCHASHYDLAGRVFRTGPAPKNLPIPAYRFASESRLVIGEDA